MNEEYVPSHFKIDYKSKANKEAVVQGEKYRFTFLTDRFIRLEYSETGIFEDRASQKFLHRYQELPKFKTTIKENKLTIKTKYLELKYNMEEPFLTNSLSIKLKDGTKWKYGTKEKNNRLGTARTLDQVDGDNLVLEPGLFSLEGYVVIDDSTSALLDKGWIYPRIEGSSDNYFFAYKDDFKAGLRDFYKVSGSTPLIPRYALGNWWSRYWNYDEKELKELITNFEKRDIPLSVCIIDMDWHLVQIDPKYGSGWTGYTWNKELFPDPKGMLDWLKDRGIKKSLNVHPADGIRGHEDMYLEVAKKMGKDYSNEEAVEFDFTDPLFVKTYFESIHHPYEDMGIDFWWIDWQQGTKTKLENIDPLWMLNHYHYLDLARNESKRGFTFSRWPGLGGHRYPVGFSGDTVVSWNSLEFQPFFTANAAYVGFGWWSHDIGGHMQGIEDSELYTRWVQLGVFSPIMRLHTSSNYYHKREPWRHEKRYEDTVKKYMRLRHQLVPYIYTHARKNSQNDVPLVTPMTFVDSNQIKYNRQYFFGDSLLVSPVVSKIDPLLNRSITNLWLPKGFWYDYFTGEMYRGEKEYTLYNKLDEMPVFAKSGSIIPLDDGTLNASNNPEILRLKVFPGSNSYTLYEDDGYSRKFKEGMFVCTTFSVELKDNQLSFRINAPQGELSLIPKNRKYIVEFVGTNNEDVVFEELNIHEITVTLDLKPNPDPVFEIMDILEYAQIETHLKSQIGYIKQNAPRFRAGILASDESNWAKAKFIKTVEVPKSVKKMCKDILLKHD